MFLTFKLLYCSANQNYATYLNIRTPTLGRLLNSLHSACELKRDWLRLTAVIPPPNYANYYSRTNFKADVCSLLAEAPVTALVAYFACLFILQSFSLSKLG